MVTDKNKIRREVNKVNKNLQQSFTDNLSPIKALYFDGRKDSTQAQVKKGSKCIRTIIKEKHISVLSEPGLEYIDHIVPSSGSDRHISQSLYDLLLKYGGTNELEAIECDRTAAGWRNGAIRYLERQIDRRLQWFICQLHFNELPFRALFLNLDGQADGPNSFSGPIGKQLKNCETKPILAVKFAVVDCD